MKIQLFELINVTFNAWSSYFFIYIFNLISIKVVKSNYNTYFFVVRTIFAVENNLHFHKNASLEVTFSDHSILG